MAAHNALLHLHSCHLQMRRSTQRASASGAPQHAPRGLCSAVCAKISGRPLPMRCRATQLQFSAACGPSGPLLALSCACSKATQALRTAAVHCRSWKTSTQPCCVCTVLHCCDAASQICCQIVRTWRLPFHLHCSTANAMPQPLTGCTTHCAHAWQCSVSVAPQLRSAYLCKHGSRSPRAHAAATLALLRANTLPAGCHACDAAAHHQRRRGAGTSRHHHIGPAATVPADAQHAALQRVGDAAARKNRVSSPESPCCHSTTRFSRTRRCSASSTPQQRRYCATLPYSPRMWSCAIARSRPCARNCNVSDKAVAARAAGSLRRGRPSWRIARPKHLMCIYCTGCKNGHHRETSCVAMKPFHSSAQ